MAKKQKLGKGKKPTNAHQKEMYAKRRAYITEANRKRKRLKHLAFNPNDLQTLAALKKVL